ncbi:outer membrane beta-barrel protein [Solimonas terrae]|uniref:outer membrane beta-barrel protein n=1 Tax=Solimonas terrae TaxID=1396819 RepID=UPI003450B3CA
MHLRAVHVGNSLTAAVLCGSRVAVSSRVSYNARATSGRGAVNFHFFDLGGSTMKRVSSLLAGLFLLPAAAHAGVPYFGGSGVYAERPAYNDINGSFGGKVFAGYRFEPVPIFLEASYLDTGKADIDDTGGATLNFSGYTLGAGYFFPLSPSGSGFWLRGAYYDGHTKVALDGDSAKISASGFEIGFGGDWKFNDWVGLRFEIEDLLQTKDFADNENVEVGSIGLVFTFPTQAAPVRLPPPPQQNGYPTGYVPPAAIVAPPAPPAPPAVEAAPSASVAAPVIAPPSPMSSSGGQALKTQPRIGSETELVIPAGVALKASGQMSNPEGDWIFVEYNGQTGWVLVHAR